MKCLKEAAIMGLLLRFQPYFRDLFKQPYEEILYIYFYVCLTNFSLSAGLEC